MTLDEYLATYDESHPYTTSKSAVWLMATLAARVGAENIMELGTFEGRSLVAFALACPQASITGVDKCDVVSPNTRAAFYARYGILNIVDISGDAGEYLRAYKDNSIDVVFHDAQHGEHVMPEYYDAWRIAKKLLVVHDWEQTRELGSTMLRETIVPNAAEVFFHHDQRGRVTLLAHKK